MLDTSGPRWFLSLLLLAVLALAGCGGPTYVVEKYPGAQRSADEVAILRFRGTDEAQLVTVDGERADIRIDEDARLHVEVLPGEHRVAVVRASDLQGPLNVVAFRAEAGKVYGVAFGEGPGAPARAYEIDADSDALLHDVTLPPAQDVMSSPPPPAPRASPPPVSAVPVPDASAGPAAASDVAARWMEAMMQDQLDAAMALSGVPFSWDRNKLVESREDLRKRVREVMEEKDHADSKVGAAELVTPSAEDLAKWYSGTDPVQVVRFPVGDGESVLVFVRRADQKVVGFSD
jgi:hypothetical protein